MADIKPRRFGKYILLDSIGMGGMAELYRAKILGDKGFEKLIAVKKLLPHYCNDEDVTAAFIDEAKLAAFLQHQNIIQIYEFGSIDGIYFIAMEYLFGVDLRKLLNRTKELDKPLSIENTLYIISRVCSGLDYVRKVRNLQGQPLNVVHRDISPPNIFITYEGLVKVIDFGIAKAESQSQLTRDGLIKGKVAYMSPEQAEGKPMDHRSDIFSVGIVLYELLTGERTFDGETVMEVLKKVQQGDFQWPQDIVKTLKPHIYDICQKALAKDPGDRYQSAGHMFSDIEQCLIELSIHPSSTSFRNYVRELFLEDIKDQEVHLAGLVQCDCDDSEGTMALDKDSQGADDIQEQTMALKPASKNKTKKLAIYTFMLIIFFIVSGILAYKYVFIERQINDEGMVARSVRNSDVQWSEYHKVEETKSDKVPNVVDKEKQKEQGEDLKETQPIVEKTKPVKKSFAVDKKVQEAKGLKKTQEGTEVYTTQDFIVQDPVDDIQRDLKSNLPMLMDLLESGKNALEREYYLDSLRLYEKALKMNPAFMEDISIDYSRALEGRAFKLMAVKSYKKAKPLLLKAIDINPYNAKAYYRLATMYRKQKDNKQAIKYYEKTIAIDPGYDKALFNLGYLYVMNKKYEKAKNMYIKVVELKPDYLDEALVNLAMVYLQLKDKNTCIAILKSAIEVNPKNQKAKQYLKKFDK